MSGRPLEDVVDGIRPCQASNLLLWSIAAALVLLVGWAALTRIDRTVHGQGRVVPTAQVQTVSNLEGGIVAAILVRAGDRVAAGAPLVRLDETASGGELGGGREASRALAAKAARLQAEVTGGAPAFAADAPEQAAIERSLYLSRRADIASITAAGAARVAQADRAVAEADAALVARRAARDSAAAEESLLRPLVARGIEPRLSLVQAENSRRVAEAEVAAAQAAAARARAGVAEARAAAALARQDWRSKAADELAATRAELAVRREGLPALESRLGRATVRAPLAGRVNRVLATTVGGTVRPGEPLVEIVPADGRLTVEVRVRPQDIAFVRLDQPARVKISAYDYSVYGALEGRVTGIAPDAVSDERTGESYYTVRIRAGGRGLAGPDGHPLPIGPGMVADVDLIGDRRSVLSYILTPITHLRESAFSER